MDGSVINQVIESNRIQNRKEGESNIWQIDYKGKLQRVSPLFRHEWVWQATFGHVNNYDPLQHQTESDTWQSDGKLLRSTRRTSRYALTYEYDQLRDAWHPRFSIFQGSAIIKQKVHCYFIRLNSHNRSIGLQFMPHLFGIFYYLMRCLISLWGENMEQEEDQSSMKNNYNQEKMLLKFHCGKIATDYNKYSIMKRCHVGE